MNTQILELYNESFDPVNNTCVHFAKKAYKTITGIDISDKLPDPQNPFVKQLIECKPEGSCIVLCESNTMQSHVGVLLNGKVLNMTPKGVQLTPLELFNKVFNSVKFYR